MNKIACHIRVSTDEEEQLKSLEQQKVLLENQYKDILMYSDMGTGISFDRKGFQQLMYDARLNNKVLKEEDRHLK
ncbi:recombinase family protein [Clostridium algidicarnis]|uniref:recombinase family protein n=1 Tax=Clostridium algidicarnis TaxID=37659 RepID=UPI0021F415B4|nr:recombinase family protein [Clostridium algidicarnis]